jgi:hypothetical protein
MPPLMPAARLMFTASKCQGVAGLSALGLTAWALVWSAAVLAVYLRLRRTARP